MVSTTPFSALSLGFPPSPQNGPANINIDLTCAAFALEVARKRVAMTSESRKKRIEDDCEHEIPRLHRILNLPFTPRANRNSSSTSLTSTNSSSISTAPSTSLTSTNSSSISTAPPTSEADKGNEAPRSSDTGSTTTRNVDENRIWAFPTHDSSSGNPYTKKQTSSSESFVSRAECKQPNVSIGDKTWGNSSTFLPKERRMPLGDLDPSSLSPEQKIVRRSTPTFTVDKHQLINPFNHIERIGELRYVDRNVPIPIIYPYGVVTMSTIEVVAPRPVGVNQYQYTQKWLQKLMRELEAD